MAPILRRRCLGGAACRALALLVAGLRLGAVVGSATWTQKLDHGTFKGFPSFAQANELLDGWVSQHAALLRKEQIGHSYEKRPIYAYVLAGAGAAATAPATGRPQVLFTALMHSREPASLTVVLYIIGHLLELFAQGDPQAVYLVKNREMWFVPFVNPDGYIANQNSPTHPVIRKNRRPTCANKFSGGVDINRNFAVAWKKGQFPPCDEEYQGSEPFSEPETQALKSICDRNSFKAAMNFHAFGSMLTHPYNWAPTAQRARLKTPDDDLIYNELQSVFKFDKFGPAIKTVGYTAPGESDDWFYDAKGIISMSPEVGPESGGFFPPISAVAGIDSRNYVRAMHLAVKAGFQLGTRWRHLPADSSTADAANPVVTLELEMRNTGLSSSAGEMLAIAVAGFADGTLDEQPPQHASLRVISGHDGTPTEAQLYLTRGAPMVTFRAPLLQRRSKATFRFVLAGAWASSQTRPLEVCVLETVAVAGAEASKVKACQCSPPTKLPMSTSHSPLPPTTFSDFKSLRFTVLDGAAADSTHLLCARAGAAASTAFQPNSGDAAGLQSQGGGGGAPGARDAPGRNETLRGSAGAAATPPPPPGGGPPAPGGAAAPPLPSGGSGEGGLPGPGSSGGGGGGAAGSIGSGSPGGSGNLAGGLAAAGLVAVGVVVWLRRRCRQSMCAVDDEESRPVVQGDGDGDGGGGAGRYAVEPRTMGVRVED